MSKNTTQPTIKYQILAQNSGDAFQKPYVDSHFPSGFETKEKAEEVANYLAMTNPDSNYSVVMKQTATQHVSSFSGRPQYRGGKWLSDLADAREMVSSGAWQLAIPCLTRCLAEMVSHEQKAYCSVKIELTPVIHPNL